MAVDRWRRWRRGLRRLAFVIWFLGVATYGVLFAFVLLAEHPDGLVALSPFELERAPDSELVPRYEIRGYREEALVLWALFAAWTLVVCLSYLVMAWIVKGFVGETKRERKEKDTLPAAPDSKWAAELKAMHDMPDPDEEEEGR